VSGSTPPEDFVTGRSHASLPAAVHGWAFDRPNAPALRQGDVILSWKQLDEAILNVARALETQGVTAQDRVMLLGENSLEWVIAFLGCQRARIIVAPTNTRISATQVTEQARVLDAQLIVVGEELSYMVTEASAAGFPTISLTALCAQGGARGHDSSEAPPMPFATSTDTALVSFTSGTTGIPKGATISHGALYEMSRSFSSYFGTGPEDTTLVMVPIFHNTGFVDQLGHMVVSGGATAILPRYKTSLTAIELVDNPVTYLAAVPSMLRMLMLHDAAEQVFSGIRTIMFGGSPMPGAWTDELLRRWPHLELVHAYGLTEFTSVCTFLPPDMVSTKGESVGLPLPGVEVAVMVNGEEVDDGEFGEIWIAGPTRMTGYWKRPDLTSQKVVGSWLRTGDIGRVDSEGFLWLAGREDDVINRGGEKILPPFVESHISHHQLVAAASVFSYPDEVLQQRVAAAVQLRSGTAFDEADLKRFLIQVMPDYAIPDKWVVYDELPLNPSGKIDRRAVAAEFMANRERAQDA
jgi:long-chain acyl-CoA synthetase